MLERSESRSRRSSRDADCRAAQLLRLAARVKALNVRTALTMCNQSKTNLQVTSVLLSGSKLAFHLPPSSFARSPLQSRDSTARLHKIRTRSNVTRLRGIDTLRLRPVSLCSSGRGGSIRGRAEESAEESRRSLLPKGLLLSSLRAYFDSAYQPTASSHRKDLRWFRCQCKSGAPR